MNPNELRQKKAHALAEAKRLNDEISAENCDLTDDQKAARALESDEHIVKAEAFEVEAKAIEAKELEARARADRIAALGTTTQIDSNSTRRTAANDVAAVGSVQVEAPNFEHDPMKGFEKPYDFFSLVARDVKHHSKVMQDPRMEYLAAVGSDEQMGSSDPYGGFLLPEAMEPGVKMIDIEADPFVGKTTPLTMNVTTVKVNALVDKDHSSSVSGGFTVSRSSETASKTATRAEMEQITFHANSEFGFAFATEELLEDSPGTIASLLSTGFAREFQSNHIQELLRGTGVGMREGVQNNPALLTVAKEGSQAADTIKFENIIKMRARCYGYSGAMWLYNHDCLPQLMSMTMTDGSVSAWQTSARDGEPDRLFGRPAIATEYCETIGDLNDIMLIVPSAIYEGTYRPLQSAESMHVRFQNHERAFKFWQRNDARSLWRSVLTPNKGATLSPFVTLAARA